MRRLPKGVDPNSLPDLAHYRGHGIDRVTAWCLTPFCFHQARVTFADLARHGAVDRTALWDHCGHRQEVSGSTRRAGFFSIHALGAQRSPLFSWESNPRLARPPAGVNNRTASWPAPNCRHVERRELDGKIFIK